MKSDVSVKLLLCIALKEEEEGDWDTRHTFVVKNSRKRKEEIGTYDMFVVKKKKILPPFLLIFSFLNKVSTLKQKLVY